MDYLLGRVKFPPSFRNIMCLYSLSKISYGDSREMLSGDFSLPTPQPTRNQQLAADNTGASMDSRDFDQMFEAGPITETKRRPNNKRPVRRQQSLHLLAVRNRMTIRMNSLPNMYSRREETEKKELVSDVNFGEKMMLNSKVCRTSLKKAKKDVARVKSAQSHDPDDSRASFRRKSSLPGSSSEMEITRQFVTKRKKIINKGDTTKIFSDANFTKTLLDHKRSAEENVCEYEIHFHGGLGVGKTSIIDQFIRSEHDDVFSRDLTINIEDGEESFTRNVFITVDGKRAKLSIQESSNLSIAMPSTCDCNVIVYAVSDRHSFDIAVSLLSRLYKISRETGSCNEKRVILVGNKTDLARKREVSSKEGRNTAILYGSKFIETGAGIGHNIDQLLVGIVLQSRLQRNDNNLKVNSTKKDWMKGLRYFPKKLSQKKKKVMNLHV